jgi:HEAT repeat protein
MAKLTSIEDRLAELSRLAESLESAETRKQLRKHLASKSSPIVARAAQIIARIEDHDFGPELIQAFHRFLIDPTKTDKGCLAKCAVVKALLAADCDDEELFRKGVRHIQLEPTWGGRADTAAQLRALCGLGLVQVGSRAAMDELAALLADEESDARIGAAAALGHCGPTATPLLRFKLLSGDNEAAVLAECLTSLMKVAPSDSFQFVSSFVDLEYPFLYEHAGLTLAESKLPGVFELLKNKWTATFDREFKKSLLLPMAITRSEEAREFLISVIESGELGMATAAIAAMRIFAGDDSLRSRLERAIEGPNQKELSAAVRREFN